MAETTTDPDFTAGGPPPTGRPSVRLPRLFAALDTLLREPTRFADVAAGPDGGRRLLQVAAGAAVCFAAYGATAGTFSAGLQPLIAAAKAPLIVAGSLLLCLPSLYVFGSLAGVEWTSRRFGAAVTGLAGMLGLLLVAMLPVAWLFSVSSRSLAFVGLLHLLLWAIALAHAHRFVRSTLAKHPVRLLPWFVLLFVVSLQVATQLRPVLTPGDHFLEVGKKSFLEQWGEAFD